MDEYVIILILTYFKQYKEQYLLSELIKILGINIKRLDRILTYLMKESLIEYKDGLLMLTENGCRVLICKDEDEYHYNDSGYINFKIHPSKAWPIDKPYVPIKFMTKI